ncbi:MAG: L,D-transpeptidase family protein [Candidatus Binatia bacterium]
MRGNVRTVCFAAIVLAWPLLGYAGQKADLVVIKKSESRLYLQRNGKPFASFEVVFGGKREGHKMRKGDKRTPEGRYVLDLKNSKSTFYRAIRISYPNAQDRVAARARGVHPGGLIMIHGQKNGLGWMAPVAQLFDWTDGCVALSNSDMDKVWDAIEVGTPIEIYP